MGDRTQQLLLATLPPSTFRNKNMLYLSWVDLYVAINWLVFSLRTTNVPGGLLILPHCGHCQHYHNYPVSVSLIQTWRWHPMTSDQRTRCLRLYFAPLQCLIVNSLICCAVDDPEPVSLVWTSSSPPPLLTDPYQELLDIFKISFSLLTQCNCSARNVVNRYIDITPISLKLNQWSDIHFTI